MENQTKTFWAVGGKGQSQNQTLALIFEISATPIGVTPFASFVSFPPGQNMVRIFPLPSLSLVADAFMYCRSSEQKSKSSSPVDPIASKPLIFIPLKIGFCVPCT